MMMLGYSFVKFLFGLRVEVLMILVRMVRVKKM